MSNEPSQPLFNYATLWANIEREAMARFINHVSRRDFMKVFGVSMAALTAGSLTSARIAAAPRRGTAWAQTPATTLGTLPNGIAAGDTTQTSAMLWTRSTTPGTVTFEVSTSASFDAIPQTLTADVTEPSIPVKVAVEGLTAGTLYFYRVTDADGTVLTGRFQTPAAAGEQVPLRFGVTGDWRGELRPYVGVRNAVERDLAFFIALGDTIYADIPSVDFTDEQARTLEDFRIKHNEVYTERYGVNFLADLRAATATFATIDDHEVTNDFAGGAAPDSDERFAGEVVEFINQTEFYRNGLATFQAFNPLRDEVYESTDDARMDGRPKLYRYTSYGSTAAVYMLDARSFRDEPVPTIATTSIFNGAARAEFRAATFAEGRTFLGRTQVDDLKRDLLAAHEGGIIWKFVIIPEPIMNMGWFGGNDRWEGYAPERTEVLQFIADNAIANVVFVSADVHTTFLNNLTYQTAPDSDLVRVPSWEISTGSLAFYPPTGAALVEGAAGLGLVPAAAFETYQAASVAEKDLVLEGLYNQFVAGLEGYEQLGFEGSGLPIEMITGGGIAGHTFGWTEFDINADGVLTVTTYGIPAYSPQTAANDSAAVLALQPEIVNQFVVTPL